MTGNFQLSIISMPAKVFLNFAQRTVVSAKSISTVKEYVSIAHIRLAKPAVVID